MQTSVLLYVDWFNAKYLYSRAWSVAIKILAYHRYISIGLYLCFLEKITGKKGCVVLFIIIRQPVKFTVSVHFWMSLMSCLSITTFYRSSQQKVCIQNFYCIIGFYYKHRWKCPKVYFKTPTSVVTNWKAWCPVKNIQFWSPRTQLESSPAPLKSSQCCRVYKCCNADASCGQAFGSPVVHGHG